MFSVRHNTVPESLLHQNIIRTNSLTEKPLPRPTDCNNFARSTARKQTNERWQSPGHLSILSHSFSPRPITRLSVHTEQRHRRCQRRTLGVNPLSVKANGFFSVPIKSHTIGQSPEKKKRRPKPPEVLCHLRESEAVQRAEKQGCGGTYTIHLGGCVIRLLG